MSIFHMENRQIEQFKAVFEEAEAVLIGAGAGLSAAAGYSYAGERFHKFFSDFEKKYHFHDMYSGGFYPYESLEEYWAYWSRYILINRYSEAPKPVYRKLLELVRRKEYFVLTTNVDHCFQKAGFDKARLFYTQGDYGLFQCSKPCCNQTYDNEEAVRRMVKEQRDMKIPTELIPRCPNCGKPMTMNLRSDEKFVQDSGWYEAYRRYREFLSAHRKGRLLLLELGVGMNTPGIIKYPFWRMTAENEGAFYVCINDGEAFCPKPIENRALCNSEIGEFLSQLG